MKVRYLDLYVKQDFKAPSTLSTVTNQKDGRPRVVFSITVDGNQDEVVLAGGQCLSLIQVFVKCI